MDIINFEKEKQVLDDKDISLLTCTPVLAMRKLNDVPASPFLSNNNMRTPNNDRTPIMTGVKLHGNGDTPAL